MQSLRKLVTIVTSAEWCRHLAACPSPCWEGSAHFGCASTPIDTVSRCEGGNPLPWPWTSPSGGPIHMLINRQGQHIPLTQCSTVLRKALHQASSSLAYVSSWSLVTRDSLDHFFSPSLWNRVLGSITYYHCMMSYFVLKFFNAEYSRPFVSAWCSTHIYGSKEMHIPSNSI